MKQNKEKKLYKMPFDSKVWVTVTGGNYLELTLSDFSRPLYTQAYSLAQAVTYYKRRISDILAIPFYRIFIRTSDIIDMTSVEIDID